MQKRSINKHKLSKQAWRLLPAGFVNEIATKVCLSPRQVRNILNGASPDRHGVFAVVSAIKKRHMAKMAKYSKSI